MIRDLKDKKEPAMQRVEKNKVPGSENSMCKGLEVGTSLASWRNREKANLA